MVGDMIGGNHRREVVTQAQMGQQRFSNGARCRYRLTSDDDRATL